jgi:5-methylcytosine-specific restriction endonuclease McrA
MYALSLNADHQPLKIISYQRAVGLVLEGTAYLVRGYEGVRLNSAHGFSMEWPAVIALYKYVDDARPRVKFNRQNVMARDRYTCQYCAERLELEELTLDHVVPRAQGIRGRVVLPWSGRRVHVTCWENVAAACECCNAHKAARTPQQAGMRLLRLPKKPTPWDCVLMPFIRQDIPHEWKQHVPAEWRNYWDDELDAD